MKSVLQTEQYNIFGGNGLVLNFHYVLHFQYSLYIIVRYFYFKCFYFIILIYECSRDLERATYFKRWSILSHS